jgi:hypothetical protein
MFDHVAPTVFWPLLVLFWFLASLVVGLFVGRICRWADQPQNRYMNDDHVAAMKRTHARNGFKSRQGIR